MAQAQTRKRLARAKDEETFECISISSIDKTPAKMKEADPDYRSWKDFFGLVPRRSELIAHLHDNFQICVASSASLWSKACQYAVDVLLKLGETIAKPGCTQEVQVR